MNSLNNTTRDNLAFLDNFSLDSLNGFQTKKKLEEIESKVESCRNVLYNDNDNSPLDQDYALDQDYKFFMKLKFDSCIGKIHNLLTSIESKEQIHFLDKTHQILDKTHQIFQQYAQDGKYSICLSPHANFQVQFEFPSKYLLNEAATQLFFAYTGFEFEEWQVVEDQINNCYKITLSSNQTKNLIIKQLDKDLNDQEFNDLMIALNKMNPLLADKNEEHILPQQLDKFISTMSQQNLTQQLQLAAENGIFNEKGQEIPKESFKSVMLKLLGSEVHYVDASGCSELINSLPSSEEVLEGNLFCWKETKGVQYDIPNASSDNGSVHLFAVASQFNATESPTACTPKIGNVMEHSKNDHSQGPFAQRTNPIAFELVNAFLTHFGFNMLDKALPESVGKTYPTEAVGKRNYEKTTILHGYLSPASWGYNDSIEKAQKAKDNLIMVRDYLKAHIDDFETVCYSSKPTQNGNPVHLILAAAPCSDAPVRCEIMDEIEYLIALANFTTQFKQLKALSDSQPQKKVTLHMTLPGLGVFGNNPKMVGNALRDAAIRFQKTTSEEQKKFLAVQVEIYNNKGLEFNNALIAIGCSLGLNKK